MSATDGRARLLEQAEDLATELSTAGVKRSELSSTINGLFYSGGSWKDRSRRGRKLAEKVPSLWLKKRGKDAPERLRKVREVVTRVLEEHEAEPDVRFLLGWTLRLLRVREKQERNGS
jgi:hypothetical protein